MSAHQWLTFTQDEAEQIKSMDPHEAGQYIADALHTYIEAYNGAKS